MDVAILIHPFSLIHTCDRRTDTRDIAHSVLCMLSHAKCTVLFHDPQVCKSWRVKIFFARFAREIVPLKF